MPAATRIKALKFASAAGADEIGVFGSLAAGSPATSTNPDTVQDTAEWLAGWYDAVVGGNSPAIEDMNAVFYVLAYQIFYLMEQGIPEWNAETTYFQGSIVKGAGALYVSVTDDNLNNPLSDASNWQILGSITGTYTGASAIPAEEDYVRANTTSAGFTLTLPALSTVSEGKKFTIKNVGTSGNDLVIEGNGSETIDGALNVTLGSDPVRESITIIAGPTEWEII